MAKTSIRKIGRERRKKHIRKTVRGNAARPRLCVFRSGRHIYAQIVDDGTGTTLASASSLKDEHGSTREGAKLVGSRLGALAKEKSITKVVFDRNGYLYHGRVAALADGAREAGLEF